jgi:hypothetical protein
MVRKISSGSCGVGIYGEEYCSGSSKVKLDDEE